MIRTRLVAALLMAGACGPAPRPTPAPASPPAPAPAPASPPAPTVATETPPAATTAAEPAAIPGLDLKPGDHVVVERGGVYTYAGIHARDGKYLARFRQDDHSYWVEPDKAAEAVRRLISKEEAERRLAILQDTTVFDDKRPSQPRYTDRQRAIRRGSADDQVAMLRKLYASPYAMTYGERMDLEQLETMLVTEIAIVLGDDPRGLVSALHSLHAVEGAFRSDPRRRKPDPPPPPLPRDPFRYAKHEYRGAFAVKSGALVVGDPIYTHAWRDEPPSETTRYNALVPARDGKWHCYVELAEDRRDPVMSMLVVHESIARKPDEARTGATTNAKLWVDSGQMAALDAAIRDDAAFDDAIHLGADVNGITAGRGCFHPSGGGDGTYPLWVHATGGAADLIVIDFAGESRDLLIDARKRLLRR